MKQNRLLLGLCIVSGFISAQTIENYIPSNQPDSRYQVHNNGTVTDKRTKLQWKVCSQGQGWRSNNCSGEAKEYNWQQALKQGQNEAFAGFSDWRLPNIEELRSIVAFDRYRPAINLAIFPATPSYGYYWSSSPVAYYSNKAWFFYFSYGGDLSNDRSKKILVRLVRGRQ